jgi:hypothetical protein
MIIESKKKGVCIVPCLNVTGIDIVSKIVLVPGNNKVDEEQWNAARVSVLDDIARGDIIEVDAVVEKKPVVKKSRNPDTGEESEEKIMVDVVKGKSLKTISPSKIQGVIENTFNLDTLNEWKDSEGKRDSVRLMILKQIEFVEKFGEEKAKKQREAKGNA